MANEREELKPDPRLSGITSEYILSCLLRNKYKIFTQRFDVEGFDIIAFDKKNQLFRGNPPFFIQVKTRGKKEPTGISFKEHKKVTRLAEQLSIEIESVYLAFGTFTDDIRKIQFYLIPWKEIPDLCMSKAKESFRFRRKKSTMLAWI